MSPKALGSSRTANYKKQNKREKAESKLRDGKTAEEKIKERTAGVGGNKNESQESAADIAMRIAGEHQTPGRRERF